MTELEIIIMKRLNRFLILIIGIILFGIFMTACGSNENKESENKESENKARIEDLDDGTYNIQAELSGGIGKAHINSPVVINVKDKKAVAQIVWSSSNYDYMIVDGEKYLPYNTEGNSSFEIPVDKLDEEIDVCADTVAMSEPHEIDYKILFKSETLEKVD